MGEIQLTTKIQGFNTCKPAARVFCTHVILVMTGKFIEHDFCEVYMTEYHKTLTKNRTNNLFVLVKLYPMFLSFALHYQKTFTSRKEF